MGWALGVERVLELLKEQNSDLAQPALDVYAVVPELNALPVAMKCLQALRAAGLRVQMHAGTGDTMGSMKSQFKRADASGARYALVFGADELSQNLVTVKSLRDGSGAQTTQSLLTVSDWAGHLQSQA